jgi:hypothetical protein
MLAAGHSRRIGVGFTESIAIDLGSMKSKLFFGQGLDDPNQIELAQEIRFYAQAFLAAVTRALCPTCRLICLVGQVRVNRNGRHRRSGISGPKGARFGGCCSHLINRVVQRNT